MSDAVAPPRGKWHSLVNMTLDGYSSFSRSLSVKGLPLFNSPASDAATEVASGEVESPSTGKAIADEPGGLERPGGDAGLDSASSYSDLEHKHI